MKCSEGYCVDLSNICDGVKQCRISGNTNRNIMIPNH